MGCGVGCSSCPYAQQPNSIALDFLSALDALDALSALDAPAGQETREELTGSQAQRHPTERRLQALGHHVRPLHALVVAAHLEHEQSRALANLPHEWRRLLARATRLEVSQSHELLRREPAARIVRVGLRRGPGDLPLAQTRNVGVGGAERR